LAVGEGSKKYSSFPCRLFKRKLACFVHMGSCYPALSGRYCAYDILPYLPKVVRADSFVTQIDLARILLGICHGSKLN